MDANRAEKRITPLQWLSKNAALISMVLAVLTVAFTFVGVLDEEESKHRQARALRREAEFREALPAVMGGGAAAARTDACEKPEKCAASYADLGSDVIYETAQVLLLNMSPRAGTNLCTAIGRLLAVLLVVFLGIQAVRKLLSDSLQNLQLMRLQYFGGHHIVCGLGGIGWPIADQLLRDRKRVLVIERDLDNERIDDARKAGAIVLQGDATDEKNFDLAHLAKAKAVYLVTGSDEENIEAAVDVRCVFDRAGRMDPDFGCYVHIVDPALGDVLDASLKAHAADFRVQTFNVARNTARRLIVKELTAIRPSRLDEVGLYILVGFGSMGQTLATHLAELAHFENQKRSRILILADDPQASADAFLARWGQFTGVGAHTVVSDWNAVGFEPIADEWGCRKFRVREAYRVEDDRAIEYAANAVFAPYPKSVADRGFLAAITRLVGEPGVKPAVIFCHEEDKESYTTAMHFLRSFRAESAAPVPPLFVWLPRQEPLKRLLLDPTGKADIPIRPFGSCLDELKLADLYRPVEDRIGRVILAGYNGLSPETPEGRTAIEEAWQKSTETDLNSNRMAAIHFEVKLACLGLELVPDDGAPGAPLPATDAEIEALARMEHNRWMAERLLAGWSYGPRSKCPPRRPQLCTWKWLNEDEKLKKEPAKDFDQVKAIFASLEGLGYKARKIVRPAEKPA